MCVPRYTPGISHRAHYLHRLARDASSHCLKVLCWLQPNNGIVWVELQVFMLGIQLFHCSLIGSFQLSPIKLKFLHWAYQSNTWEFSISITWPSWCIFHVWKWFSLTMGMVSSIVRKLLLFHLMSLTSPNLKCCYDAWQRFSRLLWRGYCEKQPKSETGRENGNLGHLLLKWVPRSLSSEGQSCQTPQNQQKTEFPMEPLPPEIQWQVSSVSVLTNTIYTSDWKRKVIANSKGTGGKVSKCIRKKVFHGWKWQSH